MARAQKTPKSQKIAKSRAPSRKSSNAVGYAKRRSLKSQTTSTSISDVYEYQQEKTRRAKVKLQLSKDERMEFGAEESGSEGDNAASAKARDKHPRLVGEDDEDNVIDEDDDEEIDSDAAFEESDEERFAGFTFASNKGRKSAQKDKQKKTQNAVRFAEVDLNEDEDMEDARQEASESGDNDEEDEEEEGEPSEFIDVLDVLDGRGEPESEDDATELQKSDSSSRKGTEALDRAESDEGEEGNESEQDEEDDQEADSDHGESDVEDDDSEASQEEPDQGISASEGEDDGEGPDALTSLQTFLTGLDAGQKRKAPEDETAAHQVEQKTKKRKFLKERTEAGAENEFAAHTGGGKLELDDLLAPLAGQSSNLISLKKSAKVLASSSKKLSAPLPQRTADRLDREAAYEQTKEEVDKWKATMQRIREAEHLSFPLQVQPAGKVSNLELAAKFKPTTELENAVDKLLKSAKMREEDITHTEALKLNHLSVEEVATRRAELAKMRELMFRAEVKAKRVAKIKSKTYRRIKKKERQRLAEKLGEDEDDEDDEEVRLRRETERARERATLRHKNTGKWAKAMKNRDELEEDQRRDIMEMLDRGEKLRKKIRGERESGDESGSESDDPDDEDGEGALERIKAGAFDELARLDKGGATELEDSGKKGKSIFEMKFMKDAMAREQRKADEMVDDFMKELGAVNPEDDDEGDATEENVTNALVERVGGRVVFRPGALPGPSQHITSLASDTSSVTLKSTDLVPEHRAESPVIDSPISQRVDTLLTEEKNPWLAPRTEETSAVKKKHEVVVSKTSNSADKSRHKLRKRAQKREEEKEKAKDDATVEISLSNVLTSGNEPAASLSRLDESKKSKGKAPVAPQPADEDENDSDDNSEVEEQEKRLDRKGKGRAKSVKAFEQRDLVALAFAGDNVVQDFAEQKQRETQEDAPHEIDTTLPGWGSWGGQGTSKAPPKPYLIKKVAGVDPASRADYKKAHVIISEKRDKKAAKYMVKDLPYPYTSKAQFERSMQTPIGTEWNTRLGFQRATLPKVVTKMGTVISPLEKHL